MSSKNIIEHKLNTLKPHILKVINNSADHAGHAGNPDNSDNSHFTVQISATIFDNLNKIQQHRIINNLLKDEFANGLHALSIKIIPNK